jgi:hypothetical protein
MSSLLPPALFRSLAGASACLLLALPLTARVSEPEPAESESTEAVWDETPITELNPFTVSALYAAIEVRFTLSGTDLFNPLADTVVSAEVVAVHIRDLDDVPEIKVNDTIISIDGVQLKGLTLAEIAALLDKARKDGVPAWQLNSQAAKSIRFDGDWIIPILDLKR